jgi:hypothetical protein
MKIFFLIFTPENKFFWSKIEITYPDPAIYLYDEPDPAPHPPVSI